MTAFAADTNEIMLESDTNPCVVTSNATWETTSPLANIRTLPLVDVATSTTLGTEATPIWIQFAWTYPIDLSYSGLIGTNLRQHSKFRMDAYLDSARTELVATSTTADGRERSVIPPLTDPATMRAGAQNQMRGDLLPRDFLLLPTNLHVVVPICRARVIRWYLWGAAYLPDDTDASGYTIGLAWAGDGISFSQYEGASGSGVKDNEEKTVTPGGGIWVEPGVAKRLALIDHAMCETELRAELFKMAIRAGKDKPIIYLPDVDSDAECFLYGGMFRRTEDHSVKYLAPYYSSTSEKLEEWTE